MTYDDWLQQPYIQAGDRDAAIEAEIERILDEPDFNPNSVVNFHEAIYEGALDGLESKLQEALDDPNPDFAKLGSVVWNAVYNYWLAEAENEAAKRYNEGLIGDDRD